MNGMIAQTMAWWDGRSLREQRMLAVMGVLVFAVLAWLVIVRPVWAWRADAADQRATAEADLSTIRRALGDAAPRSTGASGVDLQAVVAEVSAAGGVSPGMGMSPDGGLGFALTNVSTAAAFGWLAALDGRGVQATSLNVVENADATLSVEGALAAK